MSKTDENIIEVKNLCTAFGDTAVHKNLNLTIKRGEVLGIVGGSGSGKTTLLRVLLGLTKPKSGTIRIFNQSITTASPDELLKIQRRWGVLFQQNALFSSLNLLENVSFPLIEHTDLDSTSIEKIALLKILLAGLAEDTAQKYPAELSGGMQKRAGLARAIALDPELIFLDEPTAGLDPNTATGLDELVLKLQTTMDLTVVIITHDLDTLWTVTNRVAFLGEGGVLAVEPLAELMKNDHPQIRAFFNGPRGKAARKSYSEKDH